MIPYFCKNFDDFKVECAVQCDNCKLAEESSKKADEKLSQIFKDIIEEGVKEFYGLKTMLTLTLKCAEEEEEYEIARKIQIIINSLKNT